MAFFGNSAEAPSQKIDRSKDRFNMKRISPQSGNSPKSMVNVSNPKGATSNNGRNTVQSGNFKGSPRVK